jgi:hypothetical protein
MAQTGYTPILIYSSSTASNAPAVGNLTNSTLGSELAINITDGKLFYKDNANAIQVIGWKVVPATAGGTGLTSYTTGDILYASSSTTLARLADVATGNALISGGVGVAPSWGKIGLTTHVSGTLPIANGGTNGTATPTNGGIGYGTGTAYAFSAAGTSGNVLVSGGAGAPTWTGGPTFTATTKVNMTEAYFGLDAGTLGTGKLWYLISGGGGNITSGFFSIYNGTNGNKVFSIAPSLSEQFVTDTSGNFNMVAGNVVQGTAGKGFNFTANTPAAGMTSELLNWYEEGTWTPVVAGASTAGTYQLAGNSASYVRIGRQVTLICYVQLAAVVTGGGAGALTITGVPFAKAGANYAIGTVLFSGVDYTAGANLCCSFGSVSGSSTIYFEETNDNAASSAVQIGGVAANDYIFFSITYWA